MKGLILCLFGFSVNVSADLLLYSDSDKFYGCLDCHKFNGTSVCNKFGTFGNRYSAQSLWSKHGIGNPSTGDSPFSTDGPGLKVQDEEGNSRGYLSRSHTGTTDFRKLLNKLWDSTEGDHDEMRNIFCE